MREKSDKQVTKTSDTRLKQRILEVYHRDPAVNRAFLADITGASYGTVRNVISQYVRKEVTSRSSPKLDFSVHGWYWSGLWRSGLYAACPGVVVNKNGMKRFACQSFSLLLYQNGRVSVFPFSDDERVWRGELLAWLQGWIPEVGLPEALLREANLQLVGAKSWAVHTPGVPKKICFRVKGVGCLKTDPTPYSDGTSEFELDPNFEKRFQNLERMLVGLTDAVLSIGRSVELLVRGGVPSLLEDGTQTRIQEYLI